MTRFLGSQSTFFYLLHDVPCFDGGEIRNMIEQGHLHNVLSNRTTTSATLPSVVFSRLLTLYCNYILAFARYFDRRPELAYSARGRVGLSVNPVVHVEKPNPSLL